MGALGPPSLIVMWPSHSGNTLYLMEWRGETSASSSFLYRIENGRSESLQPPPFEIWSSGGIDASGRWLVGVSSEQLTSDDQDERPDVYLFDSTDQSLELLPLPGELDAAGAFMSTDGRFVAYTGSSAPQSFLLPERIVTAYVLDRNRMSAANVVDNLAFRHGYASNSFIWTDRVAHINNRGDLVLETYDHRLSGDAGHLANFVVFERRED